MRLGNCFWLFSIVLLTSSPRFSWGQNVTAEEVGDESDDGSGGGDIVIVGSDDVDDQVEGSGAVTVNHHVDYSMSGANGFNIR